MLLLPQQQRLVPYRAQLWTSLCDLLGKRSDELPRFKPSQIPNKLLVPLAYYQTEVLLRCNTPMSPAAGYNHMVCSTPFSTAIFLTVML